MINLYYSNNDSIRSDLDGICKWGCNREAKFKDWCSRFPSQCPAINEKRGKSISKTKKLQAMLGLNPMQNPEICKKNHSSERNRKASETLRKLGKLGLLPQQIESSELKEKRRMNVIKTLRSREVREKLSKKMTEIMRKKVETGLVIPARSKTVQHIKNGKIINFRSSWEKEVVIFLDKSKIEWMFEPFMIDFWSEEKGRNSFTIPDFFLPDFNTIIEVKADNLLREKFTLEKINAIKKSGFNFVLITRNEIKKIRSGEQMGYFKK